MKRNELKVAIASPNFIDDSRLPVWINPLDSIQSSPGGLDGTEWNLTQQQILHWTVLRNVHCTVCITHSGIDGVSSHLKSGWDRTRFNFLIISWIGLGQDQLLVDMS